VANEGVAWGYMSRFSAEVVAVVVCWLRGRTYGPQSIPTPTNYSEHAKIDLGANSGFLQLLKSFLILYGGSALGSAPVKTTNSVFRTKTALSYARTIKQTRTFLRRPRWATIGLTGPYTIGTCRRNEDGKHATTETAGRRDNIASLD